MFLPVRCWASRIAGHFTSSVVSGFSVMTSHPRSIAPMMNWSWVASTVVTMTVSDRVSSSIRPKSVNVWQSTPMCSLANARRPGQTLGVQD